jgi:hypothetical protein
MDEVALFVRVFSWSSQVINTLLALLVGRSAELQKEDPGIMMSTSWDVKMFESISYNFLMILISRYSYIAFRVLQKEPLMSLMANSSPD